MLLIHLTKVPRNCPHRLCIEHHHHLKCANAPRAFPDERNPVGLGVVRAPVLQIKCPCCSTSRHPQLHTASSASTGVVSTAACTRRSNYLLHTQSANCCLSSPMHVSVMRLDAPAKTAVEPLLSTPHIGGMNRHRRPMPRPRSSTIVSQTKEWQRQ